MQLCDCVRNLVKIIPSNGSASGLQAADKKLKIVCGSNTSHLEDGAWITEKMASSDFCQLRVSPNTSVKPNLGGIELAEALSKVIPFAAGKKDERPVLRCIRFAQKEGKLTLTSADGYRLADISLDFEDGEGEALIPVDEVKGLISALKKAHRVKVSFEDGGERLDSKSLVIDTEVVRYKWGSEGGSFPDYEKLIPTEYMAEARFDTREAVKAVASLGALSLDSGSAIGLWIKDGKVTLTATEDRGEAQIEAEAEGDAHVALKGAYLIQALKALGGMAEVKVGSPQSPILFTVDGYRLVVMPVFVAESKAVTEAEAVVEAVEKPQAEAKPKRKGKRAKAEEVEEARAEAEAEPTAEELEAIAEAEARAEMEAHSEETLPPPHSEAVAVEA